MNSIALGYKFTMSEIFHTDQSDPVAAEVSKFSLLVTALASAFLFSVRHCLSSYLAMTDVCAQSHLTVKWGRGRWSYTFIYKMPVHCTNITVKISRCIRNKEAATEFHSSAVGISCRLRVFISESNDLGAIKILEWRKYKNKSTRSLESH